MREQSLVRPTPVIVKFCLAIAIFGLAFPIYGIPFGNFKFTVFRLGLLLLGSQMVLWGVHFRKRLPANVLVLFMVLAIIRAASLLLVAPERGPGIQQLAWFLEGVFFLFAVNSFSEKFSDFYTVFVRWLFYIGLVSIAVMGAQFALLLIGGSWTLPLSMTRFGFEDYAMYWTYPYQGGQVIGPFFEYNMAGTMCALFFAVFLPYTFERSNPFGLNRYLVMASLLMTIFALVGTGSKQGFLAALVISFLLVLKSQIYKKFLATGLVMMAVMGSFLLVNIKDTSLLELLPETTFDRYKATLESGDISSGRAYYIKELLQTLDLGTVLVGTGEGVGIHAAHNAFLIVLQENGILGLLFLLWLVLYFFYLTAVAGGERARTVFSPNKVSSMGVVLSWAILLFINWAQLNVSISFLYLAVPLLFLNKNNETQNSLRL